MDLSIAVTVALILSSAGFVQGFSGFGAALVGVPLMSLMMDIHQAVPISVTAGFFYGPYLTWTNRKSIDFRTAWPIVVAGMAAAPVGVTVLRSVDARVAGSILGVAVIMLVVGQNMLRLQIIGDHKSWKAAIAGGMAGLLGGAFNTSGPPVVVYLHLQSAPKEARATMYFIFLSIAVCTLTGQLLHGLATVNTFKLALIGGPCALIGAHIGGRLSEKVSSARFKQIVTWLLVAMGAYLILRQL